MLKIRDDQFGAFLPKEEQELVDFIVEHLYAEHRRYVAPLPPDDLRQMVVNGMRRARGHGLDTAATLASFVALMFVIAPNFDEQPAIRAGLDDTSVPPDQRIDKMMERVPDSAWDEAERNYDADAWFAGASEG